MIHAAVAGATGYTGSELLRILNAHPDVEVARITSERCAGRALAEVFPQFRGLCDLSYEPLDPKTLIRGVDVVFLALPHTRSMGVVPALHASGVPVVDLSADFRLRDPALYAEWYKAEHTAPRLLEEAVYGLPELHAREISEARLVANPGCYPTAALLALAPLLHGGWIEPGGIVIDAKSGVSGAGKEPKPHLHFPQAHEALCAYRVGEHPHTPEIEQEASALAGTVVRLSFTPHLVPMNRGLLCTLYGAAARPASTSDLVEHARSYYRDQPAVQVLDPGDLPNTRDVRGTNRCLLGLVAEPRTRRVVAVSAIDNLVKGAAGQAVQNMNLLMGLDPFRGLDLPALVP